MLTIKDVKAFRGLDQKAIIKEAATVGQNASQGTVYGRMVAIAIAAGENAKAEGLKSYTFDRAGEAFATGYFGSVSEGSAKAMISALGAFTEAGMKPEWQASETAIRVFNEKAKDGSTLSFTSRAAMLRKLLKLDHVPSKKEYSDARPSGGNNSNNATIKGATAALLRSVEAFGVKWLDKLDKDGKASYAAIHASVSQFAAAHDTPDAPKPAKDGKKAAEPTMADKRKALVAELAKMQAKGGGHKTIN